MKIGNCKLVIWAGLMGLAGRVVVFCFTLLIAEALPVMADPLVAPLKTYQWGRDFLGSGTAAAGRSNLLAETKRTINLWEIAPPNGTNDAATLNTALGQLSPSSGGVIESGPGTWAFGNVVTQQNVTLRGVGGVVDFAGLNTNYWKPATNSSYVLKIGDDSRLVKGFKLRDFTMDGRAVGALGLFVSAGAFEATIEEGAVFNFTNPIKIQPGLAQQGSLLYFNRVDGNPTTVDNARGWLINQATNYPTSYLTEVVINNGHWNGPGLGTTNAFLMEVDSVEVKLVNVYHDATKDRGWKISNTLGGTAFPWIDAVNCNLDTGNSTNVAIVGYNNARIYSSLATLNFQVNGKWKELDGTLMQPPPTVLRQNSLLVYPTVYGALSLLRDGGVGFVGGTYTNTQFVVDAAGNVYLTSEGLFTYRNGPGALQVESAPSTAVSTLIFKDTLNNRTASIVSSAGDIEIWPAQGGAGVKIMDTNGVVRIQVNPAGGIFLTGTGLGANTSGLYLDSNSQLKSAAGAAATLDFPSTSAQSSSDLTVTVTGAAVGDGAVVGPPASVNANTSFTAWVSAADTVTVRFNNYSSGAVDPASGTYKVKVLK